MKIITLTGNKVSLSNDLREEYAGRIAELANDFDVMKNVAAHSFPHPYRKEDALAYFEMNRENGSEVFAMDFIIFANEEPVGIIGLKDINYADMNAHIGYWIGREYWNNGYASDALKTVSEFVKNEMKLKRLHTGVLDYNTASLKVLLKNGFSIEGYERDSFKFEGKYYSSFRLARIFD